jgi:solute:Na+ symporter, SSS family
VHEHVQSFGTPGLGAAWGDRDRSFHSVPLSGSALDRALGEPGHDVALQEEEEQHDGVAADQGMFDYLGAADISDTDPETGLPMLLRTVLPVGFMGVMMAAYFSAILSTADSCLVASSGNVVSDIIGHFRKMDHESRSFLKYSQVVTLIIGTFALILAYSMENVLDLMLYSYAFMVSGLFVPVVGALYWRRSTPEAAIAAMLIGGGTTIGLQIGVESLPYGLDANVFGISASALAFIIAGFLTSEKD